MAEADLRRIVAQRDEARQTLERALDFSGIATWRYDARTGAIQWGGAAAELCGADFATALGVTPTHLTRCCNTACGRPASALLQDRRIFAARKLLAETRIPVGKIAEQLGFNSPAYFTRAFQHLTGKSPTAFRRAG